ISEQQARAEAAAQSMGDESRSVSVSGQNRTQDTGSAFRAWLPYIILIVVVVLWTGPWSHLPGKFSHKWSEHAISSVTQKPMASTFNFNPLSGGTSILASWLVIILFLRPSGEVLKKVFARTFKQMWSLAGCFLHFCCGVPVRLRRDCELAGLWLLQGGLAVCDPCADPGLDWRGALG